MTNQATIDLKPTDSGVDKLKPKKEVLKDIGFLEKQAERFETLLSILLFTAVFYFTLIVKGVFPLWASIVKNQE